jgi:hypothetical protein
MKLKVLFVFIYCIGNIANAFCQIPDSKITEITEFINNWNELHYNYDAEALKNMYDYNVDYFNTQKTDEIVIADKERVLGKKDFKQYINGEIEIEVLGKNKYKCSFLKNYSIDSKSMQEVNAYLEIEQQDEGFVITRESDKQADAKYEEKQIEKLQEKENPTTPTNLKEKETEQSINTNTSNSKNTTPVIVEDNTNNKGKYLLVGVLLLVGGFFGYKYFTKKNKETEIFDDAINNPIENVVEENIKKVEIVENIKPYNKQNSSKEKGDAFEKYIIEKFNKNYFKVLEWRSDKYHNGISPITSQYPDFEVRYQSKSEMLDFAMECKWRASFDSIEIGWTSIEKLEIYKNYELASRIPVFVIFGIGGSPSNPNEVYIIPLKEIKGIQLSKSFFYKYKRFKTGDFFLHTGNLVLE